VNDLMDTAPLKNLLEQFGRNRVVRETGQFLDRVRVEAQSAAQRILPMTPQELAQRVARWINTATPNGPQAILNATGIFYSPDCQTPPLAPEASDAFASCASAFQSAHGWNATLSAQIKQQAEGEAVMVSTRASSALLGAMAALAPQQEVILRRAELERDPQEPSLVDLAAAIGSRVREIGSLNETSLADYETAITSNTGLVVRSFPRWTNILGSQSAPTLSQLATLTQRTNKVLLVDLGWGGLNDVTRYGLTEVPHAREVLQAGADLVLLRGNGVLGGPTCGILIGKRELIEKVAAHPLARAAAAIISVEAALAATLQLHHEATTAELSVPLVRLLATSEENLKQRAERMAPQLATSSMLASAEPVASLAALTSRQAASEQMKSWSIALVPKTGSAPELARRLLQGPAAIATTVENDRVMLNLRTISPKEDLELVDAILNLGEKTEEAL
jgi:L-seryl-tRNA(Ser) seleniumtransferase